MGLGIARIGVGTKHLRLDPSLAAVREQDFPEPVDHVERRGGDNDRGGVADLGALAEGCA